MVADVAAVVPVADTVTGVAPCGYGVCANASEPNNVSARLRRIRMSIIPVGVVFAFALGFAIQSAVVVFKRAIRVLLGVIGQHLQRA